MSHDEAHLLALLAAQLGFIPQEKLEAAGTEWLKRRASGVLLSKVLVEQGALTGQQLVFLENAVREVMAAHGSATAALGALSATAMPQLHRSLGAFDTTLRSGEHAVPSDSLDGVELVSQEAPGRYAPARTVSGETEVLGRGGLGLVTTVTDAFVGRQVAMKQLHAKAVQAAQQDTVTSTALEARFLREARVTGQLEHPGIVPVFEIGRRADDTLYYTMRRIKGRTLAEAIAKAKTLPERLALLPSVLTVCQAVAYAHSRHVIHRDLKPQNVMLGDFGETYLLDWGLARVKGKKDLREGDVTLAPEITGSRHAGVVGTPAYMSPEQARGDAGAIDERSDVWGLGGLVFETLTGRPPFVGASAWDVIANIGTEPLTPVRALAPEVPLDLAALCEKALRKDPLQRYQTARELAKDLEAFLNGRRVSAYAYSSREVLGRFVKRYRAVLAVAGAALVGLAGLGVASYVRILEERNDARDFVRLVVGDVGQTLKNEAQSLAVLDTVTRRADTFYRRLGPLGALAPDELEGLGDAWARLGEINQRTGRTETAEACYRRCLETVAARAPGERRPVSVANELDCLNGLMRSAQLSDRDAEAAQFAARADALLAQHREGWPESRRWQESISFHSRRAAMRALEADEPEQGLAHLERALAVDRALYASQADNDVRRRIIVSTAQLELILWSQGRPEEALAAGAKSVPLTQGDISTLTGNVLGTLASFLRQHGMLLGWVGRDAEGQALMRRSEALIKQALTLDPADMVARGEYGDLLLELGRAEDAHRQYLQVSPQMKDDYLASAVLAAFAAGHDEAVLARQADIEASNDSQSLWVLATVLAARGDDEKAVALLGQARDAQSAVQLPRQVLYAVTPRLPERLRPLYRQFLDDAVQALAHPEGEALSAAYQRYADGLKRLPPPGR